MKNVFFVILCGGGGERLWPLSRKNKPKQFIPFLNNKTLLEETVERVSHISKIQENIGVVTVQDQVELVKNLIGKEIDFIISEPVPRNTAPAILYSCFKLQELTPDSVVVFLQSDHFIPQKEIFAKYINQAIEYAFENNKIITLGAMPTWPATGYGYIQAHTNAQSLACAQFYDIEKFHEKPDVKLAQKYLEQGNMLWNIGILAAKVSIFINEFKNYAPDVFADMQKFLANKLDYQAIKNISIDYAVMEKSKNIVVLPTDFEWSDVGNLDIFLTLQAKYGVRVDHEKNRIINFDGSQNLVHSKSGKTVVFLGVNDLCLVEDGDIILVAKRSEVENVKKVLQTIKDKSWEEFL